MTDPPYTTARHIAHELGVTPGYVRACARDGTYCRGHRIDSRSPTPGERVAYGENGGLADTLYRAVPLGAEDDEPPAWWLVVEEVCGRWVVEHVRQSEGAARKKLDCPYSEHPPRMLVCWWGTRPVEGRAVGVRERREADHAVIERVRARRVG